MTMKILCAYALVACIYIGGNALGQCLDPIWYVSRHIPSAQNLCKESFCWMLSSIHNNSGNHYYLPPFLNPIREYWISSTLFRFFHGLCMRPFVRSLADLTCPTVSGVSYWKVARPGQAKRDDVGLFVMVSNPFILSSQTAHTPTPSPPKPQNSVRFLLAKFKQISAQAGSPC